MHPLIPIPMGFMVFILIAGASAHRDGATPPQGGAAVAREVRHVPAPLPKRDVAHPTTTAAE